MTFSLLKQGSKIGLVAPAGAINSQKLQTAIDNVQQLGFQPVVADGILKTYGYLAGDDISRANQINSMFANSDVKAIVAVRGGFGCAKILDLLDYKLILNNPKPLCGYSDLTALLIAVYLKTGITTFHSEMFGTPSSDYSYKCFKKVFCHKNKSFRIIMPSKSVCKEYKIDVSPKILNYGTAKGTLIGGNLTLLLSLIGTKYDFDYAEKILFFEEVNEPPYKIDRMLTQLQMCGKLDNLSGVIIGINNGCDEDENSLTLSQVIENHFANKNYPVVTGYPFGHIPIRCTLPIGAMAKLTLEGNKNDGLIIYR